MFLLAQFADRLAAFRIICFGEAVDFSYPNPYKDLFQPIKAYNYHMTIIH